MPKTVQVDLIGVLRKHALLLRAGVVVPPKDTAKMLLDAADAIEILRALHWGVKEEETCAKT